MIRNGNHSGRNNRTIDILFGGRIPEKIPDPVAKIAEALDDPRRLPYLIEEITTHKDIGKYRIHLVRVQVESELRMREDVDFHSTRLWIAQTIEKVAFGDLLTEGIEEGVSGGSKGKKSKKK